MTTGALSFLCKQLNFLLFGLHPIAILEVQALDRTEIRFVLELGKQGMGGKIVIDLDNRNIPLLINGKVDSDLRSMSILFEVSADAMTDLDQLRDDAFDFRSIYRF